MPPLRPLQWVARIFYIFVYIAKWPGTPGRSDQLTRLCPTSLATGAMGSAHPAGSDTGAIGSTRPAFFATGPGAIGSISPGVESWQSVDFVVAPRGDRISSPGCAQLLRPGAIGSKLTRARLCIMTFGDTPGRSDQLTRLCTNSLARGDRIKLTRTSEGS